MTDKDFVLAILPEAKAVLSKCGGGWAILAHDKARCNLVSGARTEQVAWGRAARMLGAR